MASVFPYSSPLPTSTKSLIDTSQSPPASISYSDTSCAISNNEMDSSNSEDEHDINAVMTQVLRCMDRVCAHLRFNGEYDAANSLAKDMLSMIDTFNTATAPWDIENSKIRPVSPQVPANTPAPNDRSSMATVSSSHSAPSSWAAVAAVTPAANNRLIKFTPKDAVQTRHIEQSHTWSSQSTDERVIWIRGWRKSRPLSDITSHVGQGPIYSMAFSPKDDSACVIFQYSSSAKAMLDEDRVYTKQHGTSWFGTGCEVVQGLPYPVDQGIIRMMNPTNERRRLTFARQQLFTNGMTEAKFRADINSIVGEANVELVWLFNTGNATAVFSAVPLARMVCDEFRRLSSLPGSPYRGVIISFSHDPCEKQMSLITQMPAGQSIRSGGTYGGCGSLPANIVTKTVPPGRRSISIRTSVDPNGWQMVPARKR